MKNHVVIIHGWGADSSSNWFPWLAAELRKRNYDVTVPDFPNTQNPKVEEWLEYFRSCAPLARPDKASVSRQAKGLQLQDTILVGHSLGCPFILRFLESLKNKEKIKAAFLVSAFDRDLGIPEIRNFTEKPFDWKKIKKASEKFYVINSDNDPYIPFWIAQEVAKNLDTQLVVEHNGEHLNSPAGFLEYPKLLDKILSM